MVSLGWGHEQRLDVITRYAQQLTTELNRVSS